MGGMMYTTVIARDRDGSYTAWHPEFEACLSDGETVGEARANLDEVRGMVLAHYAEHGIPWPMPWDLAGKVTIDFENLR
jgi:predicted RNase H-like HicB family nuclease